MEPTASATFVLNLRVEKECAKQFMIHFAFFKLILHLNSYGKN